MARVTYRLHTGEEHTVDVNEGLNVMLGATMNNIPGIDADCGGTLSCATCHVYVDAQWVDKFPAPEEAELALLEGIPAERKENSRLSCQLNITAEVDGLSVTVPERQF